jgi:Major Facilitator Superfamily.
MEKIKLIMMYMGGRLRRQFFMSLPEDEKDFDSSRRYYIAADSASQLITQLAGGTFLMTLLSYTGLSDGIIGTVISLVTLGAVFQLMAMNWVQKLMKRKLFVSASVLQKVWFGVIFLIPLFLLDNKKQQVLICLIFIIAQIISQLGVPASMDWIASLVPSSERGKYFSRKDAYAVFFTVFGMFLMGVLLDTTKNGHLKLGFLIIGVVLILLSFLNFISFVKMKEPRTALLNSEGKELHGSLAKKELKILQVNRLGIKEEIKLAISSSRFRKALFLNLLWTTAFYIGMPFNNSYQVKELGLSYTYIMLIILLTTILRVAITPGIGKRADKSGSPQMLLWTMTSMGIYYLCMVFTVPENGRILFTIATVFSAIGWSFIGIGLFNIQLMCMDRVRRTQQYTILSGVSGLYGFIISVVGGILVDYLQRNRLSIGGRPLFAQQWMNLLGFLFIILTVLYLYFAVKPLKQDPDDEDGKVV